MHRKTIKFGNTNKLAHDILTFNKLNGNGSLVFAGVAINVISRIDDCTRGVVFHSHDLSQNNRVSRFFL